MQKVTLRQKLELLSQHLKDKQRYREDYENKNKGGYERIYPLGEVDAKQFKYNEMVKAVYNFEAELQIRKVQREYDGKSN